MMAKPQSAEGGNDTIALAIMQPVPRPDRAHLHARLADELPGIVLHSLFYRSSWDFAWTLRMPQRTHPVNFAGKEDPLTDAPWWGRPWRDLRKARRIIGYLQEHQIKALILHGYNHAMAIRLIRYCKRNGIGVFMRSDSNIRGDRPSSAIEAWIKRRLLGWVVRHCDGVMPMGALGEAYFQKYGADPQRCFRVPYEPDYDYYGTVDPESLGRFRAEHGLSMERRYLLFSGRLIPVKRVDLLIDAFACIADARPQWDLMIAGDGPLRGPLEQRVPAPLRERVRWLGFCDMEPMVRAYHAADVLVLPSDYEPWGVVINEAMAAGLAVVASDVVGAAYDMVSDRRNGRLFAAGDTTELAEALREVTDPDRHKAYRRAVPDVLAEWRKRADPVAGVRAALEAVGLSL
ncbi:MAG: glycosyltransferase family 4 protein [Planctomycetota bacterium]|nr:glycosyltransferase family 4 protein [Planctomycetota bacterium]